ncbi:MAG: extracellular solute-binding protein [Firmicutes bacterium]|jgi:ABC-type glycerol-3-phosphate transport system substrate-binding protein|nr:extracellular solute-binding protein [Bacillota bacterium]
MNVSGNRIVFFVLVFLLTAASIGEAAVTLRWRTCCRQEDRVEMFQRWARAFEEENPDIIIDWYDPPGGITQVKVEIAGGVGPDVMMQGAGIYSMLDVLMPLSPIVQKYPELRREVIPSVLDQFTWQGEIIYATPHLLIEAEADGPVEFVIGKRLTSTSHLAPRQEQSLQWVVRAKGARTLRFSAFTERVLFTCAQVRLCPE